MPAQKHSSYQCNSTQRTLQSFQRELLDHASICFRHSSRAWGHCQFHNNEEVEMVLCGWLQMQKPHFHWNKISELVPRWKKCINVLGYYDAK